MNCADSWECPHVAYDDSLTSGCTNKLVAGQMRWAIYGMLNGGKRVVRYRPDGTTDAILTSSGIQSTCPTLATRHYCSTATALITALFEYGGALLKAKSGLSPRLPENRFAAHTVSWF